MKTLLHYTSIIAFSCSTLWAQATTDNLTVQLPGGVPLEMIWIRPSTFVMGTTEEQKSAMDALGVSPLSGYSKYYSRELPAHQVTLTQGFYLGKFEVTRAQWRAVMGSTGAKKASIASEDRELEIPIVAKSWFSVQKFLTKLNEAAGDTLYRLPTEAEWECACRGGTQTLWFTGDDPASVEEYINYFSGPPQPVGTLLPNSYGLYDMGGNAGEWVLDDLDVYASQSQIDPVGAIPQTEQDGAVIRGGYSGSAAYADFELLWYSRCAYRIRGVPAGRDDAYLGFRVLRRGPQVTSVEESSWGKIKRK